MKKQFKKRRIAGWFVVGLVGCLFVWLFFIVGGDLLTHVFPQLPHGWAYAMGILPWAVIGGIIWLAIWGFSD
jgi:uncharacterized BrkB/YihY/UPF0761 family membrane protein